MAVTLTLDDLISPLGELQESMFPDGDLVNNAAAWLLQNEAVSSGSNEAARRWAYYRAYDAVASRLSNSPATISVDGAVNRTISSAQIKYYADKAQANLMEYNRLTGNESFIQLKPAIFRVF